MKITVYHGGTEVVVNPICGFGRKTLISDRDSMLQTLKSKLPNGL